MYFTGRRSLHLRLLAIHDLRAAPSLVARLTATCVLLAAATPNVMGHGTPIDVTLVDGRISISNGLALLDGYVELASDPHEDAGFDFGPNQKLRSTFPGFDIGAFSTTAQLQLEVLSRPDWSTPERSTRWLWYWEGETEEVKDVPHDLRFDISPLFGSGEIQVRQSELVSGPMLTAADTVGPFLGNDQHLLLYELQNSPAAPFGVYGVFVRLTSPGLEGSDPLLLAFRYGTAADDFAAASASINAAAGLAADFDVNGMVDGDDFLLWQNNWGITQASGSYLAVDGSLDGVVNRADYELWADQLGRAVHVNPSGLVRAAPLPEPAVGALASLAMLLKGARRLRKP